MNVEQEYAQFDTIYTQRIAAPSKFTVAPGCVSNIGTLGFTHEWARNPEPEREDENTVNFDDRKAAPRTKNIEGAEQILEWDAEFADTKLAFTEGYAESAWHTFKWNEIPLGERCLLCGLAFGSDSGAAPNYGGN